MFNIYTNVISCILHQKATLNSKKLTASEVQAELTHKEFIDISATTTRGKSSRYYLLAPTSKYASTAPAFEKLLNRIPTCDELILISNGLSTHIVKKINAYDVAHDKLYLLYLTYNKFVINIPEHACSIPHTVMDEEDVKVLCRTMYNKVENFPKILRTDTQAIWCGARPGDLIKVHRVSETAGVAVAYRYCI